MAQGLDLILHGDDAGFSCLSEDVLNNILGILEAAYTNGMAEVPEKPGIPKQDKGARFLTTTAQAFNVVTQHMAWIQQLATLGSKQQIACTIPTYWIVSSPPPLDVADLISGCTTHLSGPASSTTAAARFWSCRSFGSDMLAMMRPACMRLAATAWSPPETYGCKLLASIMRTDSANTFSNCLCLLSALVSAYGTAHSQHKHKHSQTHTLAHPLTHASSAS